MSPNNSNQQQQQQQHHGRHQSKGLFFASPLPPPQGTSSATMMMSSSMMSSSLSSATTTPSTPSAILMDNDDVSMGENSSSMMVMSNSSSTVVPTLLPPSSSPPRTVIRSRRTRLIQQETGDIPAAAVQSTSRVGRGGSRTFRQSRLFAENDDNNANNDNDVVTQDGGLGLPSPIPRRRSLDERRNQSTILEPLDLNLDNFSTSTSEGRSHNQLFTRGVPPPVTGALSSGTIFGSRPSSQGDSRSPPDGEDPCHPHPDKTNIRKRQAAEQPQDMLLYRDNRNNTNISNCNSNHPLDSSFDGSVGTNGDDNNDRQSQYFPVESPVDMYTSPQLSPSSTSSSSLRMMHGRTSTTSSTGSYYRSPSTNNNYSSGLFYQRQQRPANNGAAAAAHLNKSPCYRTLDGRTVQSKNPFSPMITSSTNSTPNRQHYEPGTKMDTCSPSSSSFQNTFMDESITFPASLSGGNSTTDNNNNGGSGGNNGGILLRRKFVKRTGFNHIGIMGSSMGVSTTTQRETNTSSSSSSLFEMDGMSVPTTSSAVETTTMDPPLASSWLYTRDGYPEKSGRYSFTGSPIRELSNDAAPSSSVVATDGTTTTSTTSAVPPSTTTTNNNRNNGVADHSADDVKDTHHRPVGPHNSVHKVRRHTKGEDVAVAAVTHGELPLWKRRAMQIDTQNHHTTTTTSLKPLVNMYGGRRSLMGGYDDDDDDKKYSEKFGPVRTEDISPTDVLSFPLLKASPSNTSTVPPTPMKPVRRPAVNRYTPIRRPMVPPTPVRKARSFDDDEMFVDTAGRGESASIDYLNLSPGAPSSRPDGGHHGHRQHHHQLVVAAPVTAAPPSRFYSDFDVIGELGNGSFGNVFKVLSRLDGCMYAIKVAHRPAKGMADKDRMLKEVYALAALSDQADTATFHIVRYHQAWMEDQRLYIQTELCTTTLHAEMQQVAPSALPIQRRYKCLREILLALEYIHKNGMVHLDIKPENIFVRSEAHSLCFVRKMVLFNSGFVYYVPRRSLSFCFVGIDNRCS